jgi:hypothetical protein
MYSRNFQIPAHHAVSRKRRSNSTRGNNRRVLFKTEHRVSYSGVEEVHHISHYSNADSGYNTVPAAIIHHHHHHGSPLPESSRVTDPFGLVRHDSLRGSFDPSPSSGQFDTGEFPNVENEFDPFAPLHFDSFDDPCTFESVDLPHQDTPDYLKPPPVTPDYLKPPPVTPSPYMPVVGHPGFFYKMPPPSKVENLVLAAPFEDVVVASLNPPQVVAPLRVVVPAPSDMVPAVAAPVPNQHQNFPAVVAAAPGRVVPLPSANQPAIAAPVPNQPENYSAVVANYPAVVAAAPGRVRLSSANQPAVAAPVPNQPENHPAVVAAAPVPNQPDAADPPFEPEVVIVHDDGLEMQGFVYEEPKKAYWKEKTRLDELGVFSHERWKKIRCIHFILPNMNDKGQAATPKTARVPHFQTSLSEIQRQVASFAARGGEIQLKIYHPDQDYSNKFLHVVNSGLPQIQSVDWERLAEIAYLENAAADKKRQHKFKDIGTTGGQCTTRVNSSAGVAKPGKKPGSSDPSIVEAMVALSDYTRAAKFEWIPDGLRPFNCDDRNDPRNKFARRIHNDCCIPAGRIGLTNVENPCGYHCDELNSQLLQYECVPTFNKIVYLHGERFRCALIGYSRRSVDEYLVRADVHGTYVEFVCSEYDLFEDQRKHVSSDLFSSSVPVKGCIPQFPVEQNPCNMDPWGHYSSVIESTLQLERKFKLNLPERMSLLRAMAVTPNSTYLYVAAATALLEQEDIDPQHREDFRFGMLVATMMVDIHRSLIDQTRSLPPRRFNCYATYRVPDEFEWNKQCEKLLLLSLTTPDSKQSKTQRRTAYIQIRRDLSEVLPYVDVLGGNHLVAIAGTLGLLPFWVTDEIEIHKGRPIDWLLTKFFADKKQRSKIKVDDVVANIGAALKTRYGGEFSIRTVENIICKVFRLHTKNRTDERFHDIHVPGQHLYFVTRSHVCVVSDDGSNTICVKGCVLPKIPFRGTYVTLAELQQELPAEWPGWDPSIKSLGARSLKGLFDKRRSEYPASQFPLKEPTGRNKWLSNQFLMTEQRLIE